MLRSKLKLRKSLLELLKSRAISRITVQELCSEAQVNRTTFYKYYKNVDDLLEHIETSILDDFRYIAQHLPVTKNPDSFIHICLELVYKNNDMAQAIFASGKYELARQIFGIFHDQFIEYWRNSLNCNDPKTLEMIYFFVMNGVIGIVSRRTDGTIQADAEELGNFIHRITNQGVAAFTRA